MKRSIAFTSIVAGVLLAGAAQAQSYGEPGVRYDYAEVIDVSGPRAFQTHVQP